MWARAKRAANHYDVCVRTLRNWQALGFPTVKIGGIVLFDIDRGDKWLREHYASNNDTAALVDEIMKGLT